MKKSTSTAGGWSPMPSIAPAGGSRCSCGTSAGSRTRAFTPARCRSRPPRSSRWVSRGPPPVSSHSRPRTRSPPDEIHEVIAAYAAGARRARQAGFDVVEVHGANGYLIDQFPHSGTNHRTDDWGGSVERRVRFLVEVTRAVIDAFGPHRVGVRLSPGGTFNDMSDADPIATFG